MRIRFPRVVDTLYFRRYAFSSHDNVAHTFVTARTAARSHSAFIFKTDPRRARLPCNVNVP